MNAARLETSICGLQEDSFTGFPLVQLGEWRISTHFPLTADWPTVRVTRHMQVATTHTHTHLFNGPLSGTTHVSRYQKGKNQSAFDFTEARDSEWQWHQLGHMQVCTSLQTDNHASTPPLSFLQAGCPSWHPSNSVWRPQDYSATRSKLYTQQWHKYSQCQSVEFTFLTQAAIYDTNNNQCLKPFCMWTEVILISCSTCSERESLGMKDTNIFELDNCALTK